MENRPKATQATMRGISTPKVTGEVPGTWPRVSTSMMRPNRIGSAKAEMASATLASASTAPMRISDPSCPRTRM